MALSNELILQLVKATQDKPVDNKESTAYGTIVKYDDVEYVQLDGSELLTPISSTTVVEDGDRVIVTIKNHTAIVTGDFTNPSANNKDVTEIGNKISEFEIVIADKVSTKQLEAEIARIENLQAENIKAVNAEIETINAKVANIDKIEADIVEVSGKVEAHEGEFTTLRADIADFKNLTTEKVESIEGQFHTLEADYAEFEETTTKKLTAYEADIENLTAGALTVDKADLRYANIDFSNIKEAAIEKLFTDSGIINDLIMKDGKVTGKLVGVTIIGDLIEGGTVKADKLVVLGEDGLYYKLNVNSLGEAVASSDEKYQNGLDGSNIIAKSITADRIAVTDLVAFGATIGGFHITDHALYSGVKESIDNSTEGIFLGDDGQINIGDQINYLKYYIDENGEYSLEIQADNIKLGANGTTIENVINEAIDNIQIGARNILLNSSFTENLDEWRTSLETSVSEIVEFDGKKCCHVQSTEFNKTGMVLQDILGKLEANTEYTISGWIRTDNIVKGTTNCVIMLYHRGYYDNNGVSTWYGYMSRQVEINESVGSWKYVTHTFKTDDKVNTTTSADISVYARDFTGDVYFYNLKLEKGNCATDWSPAPEDMESGINDINDNLTNNYYTKIEADAQLKVNTDSISASVSEIKTKQENADETIDALDKTIIELNKSVSAKMSSEEVTIAIQNEMANGVSHVKTSTGFTFNEDGLTVSKTGKEMSTTIDEDGMTIKRNDEERLIANNEGVIAYDLHARTYLIVGSNSRFEDYEKNGKKQTGCFWIGDTEV